MIEIKPELAFISESSYQSIPISFHDSFDSVYKKIKKWIDHVPQSLDNSILNELFRVLFDGYKKVS